MNYLATGWQINNGATQVNYQIRRNVSHKGHKYFQLISITSSPGTFACPLTPKPHPILSSLRGGWGVVIKFDACSIIAVAIYYNLAQSR